MTEYFGSMYVCRSTWDDKICDCFNETPSGLNLHGKKCSGFNKIDVIGINLIDSIVLISEQLHEQMTLISLRGEVNDKIHKIQLHMYIVSASHLTLIIPHNIVTINILNFRILYSDL